MPSSVLNSDDGVISGTSGIKAVGGDDGVLVFQSKGTETARVNTDKQIVAAAGTASLPVLTTTGDVNTGIYFPAADNIGFATGGTIRGRWTTDGLCFGSDTAAANALDDYEQGTWTPTVFGGSTSGTYTPSNIQAYYTKIGNQVTVWAGFGLSVASGGSGLGIISGLPFNYKSSSKGRGTIIANSLNTSNATSNGMTIGPSTSGSSTQLFIALSLDNAGSEEVSITAYSTSTAFEFTFTYTVD